MTNAKNQGYLVHFFFFFLNIVLECIVMTYFQY